MRPNNIEDIYPLAPMQQGILFHTIVAEAPDTYLIQVAWTLRGLDAFAFRRAFQEVVDRHPALRTAFAWEKLADPVQIVWKRLKLPFEEQDLRDLSPAEQADRVRRFAEEDRQRGFDPTRAPLMRVALLRLADDATRVVWSMHHLLLDGWSTQIVVREIFTLHDAYRRGQAPRLPGTRPYAEYVAWIQKQDGARDDAFWREALAGFATPTPLPARADTALPAAGPRFGERRVTLPEAEGAALSAFARARGLTMSTLLQGAWAILLARSSGEEDVVFGTTVSGRSAPLPGIEGMVGLFINTLPVRARVAPEAPVLGWLLDLQQQEAALRDHEHSALARVQALSGVARGTPLFESLVVFENFPVAEVGKGAEEGGEGSRGGDGDRAEGGGRGLVVTAGEAREQPPYPITLSAFFARSLRLQVGYDARRFEGAGVERMLGQLATLLRGIVAAPEGRVGSLPLITEGEVAQLAAWNATRVDHRGEALLHDLVRAQAGRTPEAVAVSAAGRTLDYRALVAQGDRVAGHLAALGVGPAVLVAVAMDRSLELVPALFGVLAAGGAYVPVDPSYPADRIAFMIGDARAAVVITQAAIRATVEAAAGGARVVAVEDLIAARTPHPYALRRPAPEDLAYVVYTSGSTGRPKGAMIPHRAIVNHMRWMHAAHPMGPGKALLQKTPISFDASVWEIWLPLMGGARLVMADPGAHRDPRALVRAVVAEGITDLQFVPSMAELFAQEPDLAACTSLERLFLGGEALGRALVDRLAERCPAALVNLYGPTECTVQVLTWPVDRAALEGSMAPIGRPIDNVQAHVLGPSLERVPVGVPGEIFLGGACVGRGYLGRADLTAERFVPDPFSRGGARLYRTGDLGRRRGDGALAYLGRADQQVKVRGQRIELGEVEAALLEAPGVREAAAAVREDAPGDVRLVAYAVLCDGEATGADLRAWLKGRLPEAMVPAAVVTLAALPRAPGGKVDRRALPPPGAAARAEAPGAGERATPRGPVEEALAGIFAEVLKIPADGVGAGDSFFDLGGHSLLATLAMTRVGAALGVDLPLRAVFEAPSVAALAGRVEAAITADQRRAAPPVLPVPRGREMPLSFGQERLWFLAQLDPASPAYVVPVAIRLAGDLDEAALEGALTELVRRHEVLRTTFRAAGGKPVAVIHAPAPFPLAHASLEGLPAPDRERALRAEAEAEARRPFDLEAGPVIRARLLRVGPGDHVLYLTLHHIVSDAWTSAVLTREISALYTAFHAGAPSPLPDLPVQYADYAAWQRGWMTGDVLDRQLAYWKAQLTGAPAALDLPTDRPRPPVQSFRGGQRGFTLAPGLGAAVKDLARSQGVTLYMTLLAAFDVLLYRHTGQPDVVVGTPVAGRGHAELEGLVGFFLNTLVMRAYLAPDMSFRALLAWVKEVCLGAYAHQDMPFERLVQEMQPEPDPGRSPLFQVIFNLQNAPREGMRLPGLTTKGAVAENATVKVDLTLIMADLPQGLVGRVEYAADLFDDATVERFIRRFETLLAAATKDPQRALRDLPVLPDDERRRVLVTWNDTAREPSRACFHELFEAQADATPEAPALVAGAVRVTYRELDRRANRVAHRLRALGVGPGVVVGLCVPRTADLVIGLLGVLKAGGAYVPVDPAHPPLRLAQILREAGVTSVATTAALAGRLPASGVTMLLLDAADEGDDARPEPEVTPGDLAYVLFTSGSTGAPKGVAVEHRQLVNYVLGVGERLALPAGATYAYVSTFSADLGNTVLFPSLATGGCLHVLDEALTTDPDAFAAYVAREGIDCLKIVPSHLSALLSAARPVGVLPRRLLVLGGDASTWELIARVERLAPGIRILNHYGPTETTVGVLTYPVPAAADRPPTPIVPLGTPLANSRVYVLDAEMQPVPPGAPGEVYVGGAGVARGYLGQPDLTAERFVKDPFSSAPGARLYRTGDRARHLPDGALLFLGRADAQVKIRGYRVELGEVEAALAACPALKEAAVLVDEPSPGDRRLVAFVVPAHEGGFASGTVDPATDVDALRAFLAARLPDAMIPSAFVVLGALPLTPNGKIDRRALAAVERRRDPAGDGAPRTPVEEVLAAIWADVFERERVGVHDRFNDLGGHSLLAIQIVARARDAFQVQVPLRAIFEAPTVASLADRIEALRREDEGLEAPPIASVPRGGPLPLSFAQERLWFLARLEPDGAQYNVASAARIDGPLDTDALARALGEIVRRHEVLRTTFALHEGVPVQVVHPAGHGAPLPLPVDDLRALPPAEREAAARAEAAAEARRPFDLARGPVIRARLLRAGTEEHVLLLTLHHIVSDAPTQGILDRELGVLYDAFRRGAPSPLADLPVQYADYAAWQRRWLRGEALDKQLAYWKARLAGASFTLDLPADRPRPPVMTYRGARRTFVLPPALHRALADLSRRRGVTLFMTLLAAFDVLLHRWSGQADVLVGTPMTNRTRRETEGLIGFFLNTLVLRAEVSADLPFEGLLDQVREACLGAYAHQDMPFERLVHEISPQRDLSRTPLFQVLFTFQTAAAAPVATAPPALRRRGLGVPLETAKFDLSLFLSEGPRGIEGGFEYATDLFDAGTIDRMAAHLAVLLEGAVAAPEAPIGALPILPAAERARLLVAWNDTVADVPRAAVHELVGAQAARTPEAIAVVSGARALSYRDLDARADRLARALRGLGVGPDVLVGLCTGRSIDLVVGALGVLKAGGAYVPLDPSYPAERLAFMLEDAAARVVVADALSARALPPGVTVVRVDGDAGPGPAGDPPGPVAAAVTGEDLAYVIYTSGSTGRPKGVAVPHGAVVNLLRSMAARPGLGPADRLLAVTSLSFDIAGLEIWLPLVVGARVEIAPREVSVDGNALRARLEAGGVTVLQATPATFRALVAAGWRGDPALRVLVGGEALPPKLAGELIERAGAVWNMYGPTETTIWSCVHPLERGAAVFIGRPIANTRVYVLDRALAPVPIGVAGELYIGGAGVARGYFGRAGLTAERFLPDPFADGPGARMYATGDVARWRPGGEIEYLGRADLQLKLRGFRIEPGEIEAALERHPGVAGAAVVARDDRLVAYFVAARDPAPAPGELRAALAERLPDYMIPAIFVRLDAMPMTLNRKIDRRALPAPEPAGPRADGAFVAPRDEDEIRIAAIWRDVLALPPHVRVGATDSFFDLGGHSILAVRMMAEVERAFDRKIPLMVLFESQTVEALARVARSEQRARGAWPALVPIRPGGSKRPLFLVARPNVNSLGYVTLVRKLDPDQPVYGLQMQYPEEAELGRPYTLDERRGWVRRYLELMRAVQPEGPYLLAGMCEGALIAFEMTRQIEARGERVALLGMLDAWPEENTSDRLLHAVFMRERTLRTVLQQPREAQIAFFLQRTRKTLRDLGNLLRPSSGSAPRRPRMSPWDVRMFPGPSFVPPRVRCRIDVFRTPAQPYWRIEDRELGWGDRTTGGVDVHHIRGEHETFLRAEHVNALGEKLGACLRHAEEEIAVLALPARRAVEAARAGAPGREDARAEATRARPEAISRSP